MNKITYIQLSYQEANRKIWSYYVEKYKTIKQRNRLLGAIWFVFSCIIFGCIVIFGWIAYFTVLFKDVRFTPHYLRTVIQHNAMTDAAAVSYLEEQRNKFRDSVSHNNFSLKARNTIEITFKQLLKEYSCQKSIEIKSISEYTNRKQTEEGKSPKSEIESTEIFKSNMYKKFEGLENKLIEDKYLNREKRWISVHKNKKPDIQSLVIFLLALKDNKYFLLGKDTEVKKFFDTRYSISIGQNFEENKREKHEGKWQWKFSNYPF